MGVSTRAYDQPPSPPRPLPHPTAPKLCRPLCAPGCRIGLTFVPEALALGTPCLARGRGGASPAGGACFPHEGVLQWGRGLWGAGRRQGRGCGFTAGCICVAFDDQALMVAVSCGRGVRLRMRSVLFLRGVCQSDRSFVAVLLACVRARWLFYCHLSSPREN